MQARALPLCVFALIMLALSVSGTRVTSAAATALGSLAASMPPATWAALQTTNINPVFSSSDVGGGASGVILHYSDKAVWDPNTRRFLFIGSDHNFSAAATKFVAYSEDTNAWTTYPQPPWAASITTDHGYEQNAIDPVGRHLYHRPDNDLTVRRYDLDAATWTNLPTIPSNVMGYDDFAAAVTWFPERNSLIYVSVENGTMGSVIEYSETAGAWRRIGPGSNLPMGLYDYFAQYNPVYKVVWFGGGSGSERIIYKLDSAGNITPLRNAPVDLGVTSAVIAVDPLSGDYLVLSNTMQFYKYTVATDTWQLPSGTAPASLWTVSWKNPVAGVIAASVDNGLTLFVTCESGPSCHVNAYKSSAAGSSAPPPSPPDTTPPTVSLASPPANATVSGTITLTATASDNVAVVAVQFKLDGANLGTEDTAPPYSASWDTTTATNAQHTLTAIARDAAGNQATSAAITVTVNNPVASASSNGVSSDFATRCAAAGVIRCVGFDQASDIQGVHGDNSGIIPSDDPNSPPVIDTTQKASGSGSLKFTVPPQIGSNMGAYFTNFSSDLLTQFGQNSDFYIQWRQRFSPEFLNTHYANGDGWKQTIIGTGDTPGCTSSNSAGGQCASSCTALETVTQDGNQRGFAQMYNSCTGSTSHGPYDGFEQPFGSFDFKLQNARPSPYCLYSQGNTTPVTFFPPTGNCFGYFPNEWMTFQVRIKTGPRVNDEFTNSFVELWIAREGQPSEEAINWGPYNLSAGAPSDNQKFGKVWLLPYDTNKDPSQVTPTAYTWYDELIISTNRIADPGGTTPPADTTPPTLSVIATSNITSSGATINWTTDEPSDTQVEYGTTTAYGNQTTLDRTLVTSHVQSLSGLTAGTTYNYRVKSRDAAGNLATSGNFTFTTARRRRKR